MVRDESQASKESAKRTVGTGHALPLPRECIVEALLRISCGHWGQ